MPDALTVSTVLWAIGAGATCATIVFYGSFYLGRLMQKIESAHERLDDHDRILGEMQGRRRDDHGWQPGR